jgi:beta-glucosidase/6-phospho-beta-glucosidase/beta-galactosidase
LWLYLTIYSSIDFSGSLLSSRASLTKGKSLDTYTFHWYKEELGGTGYVSIKLANSLGTPLDNNNPEDVRAALRHQDFLLGVWANAIFLGKNYPEEAMKTTGLKLTALTDDEVAHINGTADIWSFDPYTAGFVTSPPGGIDACASNTSHPLWPNCVFNTNVQSDGWLNGQASMTSPYIAPQHVRQQFGYVWDTFKPKGVSIPLPIYQHEPLH